MDWQFLVALALAIPLVMLPVVFVWYLNVGGLYAAIREGRVTAPAMGGSRIKLAFLDLARAVRLPLLVVGGLAAYGLLMWGALVKFGWPVAVVVALVAPIIFLPVALVWYLNVSGLYRVMVDARRRQKRRAAARQEARVIVRS